MSTIKHLGPKHIIDLLMHSPILFLVLYFWIATRKFCSQFEFAIETSMFWDQISWFHGVCQIGSDSKSFLFGLYSWFLVFLSRLVVCHLDCFIWPLPRSSLSLVNMNAILASWLCGLIIGEPCGLRGSAKVWVVNAKGSPRDPSLPWTPEELDCYILNWLRSKFPIPIGSTQATSLANLQWPCPEKEGCKIYPTLSGFKKALLQNPREMIRGRIFSEMIRIQARKSELRAESRSYGPKVGVTAGQTPRIRTESPRKGPRMGFGCFYRNPPLKPSWIHLNPIPISSLCQVKIDWENKMQRILRNSLPS